MPESSDPMKNTVNQQSTDTLVTQPTVNLPNASKPSYLGFLRFFAGLSLVIGVLATLAFVMNIFYYLGKSRSEDKSHYGWIIALALTLALESYLAFGLLNAVADIAENMLDVGNYVRDLKKKGKS